MKSRNKMSIILIGTLLLMLGVSTLIQLDAPQSEIYENPSNWDISQSTTEINILFLMDHNYGANYHFIRPILEGYGWTVKIAGPDNILTPCDYQSEEDFLETDFLITEVNNITDYDAISVMPGNSHDNLRTSVDALNLIQTAVSDGLVVSAWCRAVRVLAAADVIDGKNVTGHADYASEYEAAGATFNELVPPIIDGNIVTGVRSRFYRTEMCFAIATALEVSDSDPPELAETTLSSEIIHPNNSTLITARFTDESGVAYAEAELYLLTIQGERNTTFSPVSFILESSDTFIFTGNISGLQIGNYTVDLTVRDLYSNSVLFSDVINLDVANPTNTDSILDGPLVIGGITVLAAVAVIIVVIKMKKD